MEFNDPETDTPNYWPSIRMADVREVARRLKRSGMRDVVCSDEYLTVLFRDPVIQASVTLEIEPYVDGLGGWLWYAIVDLPGGFSMGSLTSPGRWILNRPWPREVVRSYLRFTRYERRPVLRKKR